MVDLLVLVGLESLDPIEPPALLDHHGHLVRLLELLRRGEDVGDPVQHHAHGLVVLGSQQVTEGFQNTLDRKHI